MSLAREARFPALGALDTSGGCKNYANMICQGPGQETGTSGHVQHSVDHLDLQNACAQRVGWLPVKLPVRLVGWLVGRLAGWLRKTISESGGGTGGIQRLTHMSNTGCDSNGMFLYTPVWKQTQMRVHLPMTI